jgi:hypothetical protein
MTSPARRAAGFALLCLVAISVRAGEVARADVGILGLSLEVKDTSVTTSAGIPVTVQTAFNRLMNEAVPPAPGLSVAAELTGPGLDAPIPIAGLPGQKLQVPALQQPGDYTLQNVRLLSTSRGGASAAFVQQATPSYAVIHVVNVLSTSVSVRQLSPDEIRARGISIDGRNFDVYEYTVLLGVQGQQVAVPFPVIVDRRTHEVIVPPSANSYQLPPLGTTKPPRFDPPRTGGQISTWLSMWCDARFISTRARSSLRRGSDSRLEI